MIQTLAIANYRSLRQLIVPLGRLNVITGANGSGKTNLYRALRLLADTAQGGVIASLAREGGLGSTLWAGVEEPSARMRKGTVPIEPTAGRKEPVNLRLGFATEALSYSIDMGMPIPSPGRPGIPTRFSKDPEIKRECIWSGPKLRPSTLLVDRRNGVVRLRNSESEWEVVRQHLPSFDTMLTEVADANRAPEVLSLRDQIRSWRFYDHFRVDADAPSRQPQLGTRTPVLSHDGRDVAAALQTIREIGDIDALDAAVSDAFPGCHITIADTDGRFDIEMHQHGLLRPLRSAELSDGTLRSLLWIAALLTPRPPALMVLDEPEMSLHPDLLPAFARLIIHASKNTQIWAISHSPRLVAALAEAPECQSIVLDKEIGETRIVGQGMLDQPPWEWPAR
jgi:predicted ATPase